jgi:hypothetical protein
VSVSMQGFCQQGTRLLLGRARHIDRALVRITLFPVAELEAALTRLGRGVRCRRFYALRKGDEIRWHFFNGRRRRWSSMIAWMIPPSCTGYAPITSGPVSHSGLT